MKKYDVVIIGGGVIGSAIAYELSKKSPSLSIALLEKNSAVCLETSLKNSGVIHSGIHLDPRSSKAQLTLQGRKDLIEFCGAFEVPYEKRGMLVVSGFSQQLFALKKFRKRARKQKIETKILLGAQIRRHEPAIKAFLGLLVDDVFVIDPQIFTLKLLEEAQRSGHIQTHVNSEVLSIEKSGEKYIIHTTQESFESGAIINAAGLYADKVSAMAGYKHDIHFYSGEYYHVANKEKLKSINSTLVYPASLPGGPGLGIHITKKINGEVYLGPNAKRSEGPTFDDRKRTSPQEFIGEIKPFWPGLDPEDIEWSYVGMRPKAADGGEDFIIKKESDRPVFINLLGIESPGLTASLAIAQKAIALLGG